MKEIWIFGDSYADRNYINDHMSISWPCQLEEAYIVKNFSKAGSSPSYQLSAMIDNVSITNDKKLKEITVLFFISGTLRFDFSFLSSTYQSVPLHYFNQRDKLFKNYPDFEEMINDENREFIVNFFNSFALHTNYEETELIKIVSTINYYSQFFQKVLVWPIFKLPKMKVVSTDEFSFVPFCLFDVEPLYYKKGKDNRNNHLSSHNHQKMVEVLSKWINDNDAIKSSKFNSHLNDSMVNYKNEKN